MTGISSSPVTIVRTTLNTPALIEKILKDKVMVGESKVTYAVILLLLLLVDVKEELESGDAVLEIGTPHTRFTKSMVPFSHNQGHNQYIN